MVLCAATMLSVTCVMIRGVYRSIELLQGWTGYLIENERFEIALDGAMIVAAVAVFNFCNPGVLLGRARAGTSRVEGGYDGQRESEMEERL